MSLTNRHARRSIDFKIFDDKHNEIDLRNPPIYVNPGVNSFSVDLSSNLIKPDQFYFAEVRLSEEEVVRLKLYKTKSD